MMAGVVRRPSLIRSLAAILLALVTACATAPSSRLHLAPCKVGKENARCGTFDVRESALSSHKLPLKVILLPATMHNESPIFIFNGGPGVPTTPGAEDETTIFAPERRLHDVVLVDGRGTGGSAKLECPKAMKTHAREIVEGEMFPDAFIAGCRAEIEAYADPAHYTINYFVDDMEQLRQGLGYKKINIVALSYGTRSAQMFLAKYPDSVRAVLLNGPLPDDATLPLSFTRDAQASFEKLIEDARGEFPNLARDIERIRWPATFDYEGYHFTISKGEFAEFLRPRLYNAAGQSRVPEIIHRAAEGDWKAIAPLYVRYRKEWYSDIGPFLSITCPTDVRWIDPEKIESATAGTFFGDYRVRRQIAACEHWTPGRVARPTPRATKVPVLIVTGEFDPVTTPNAAESIARELGNARVVVLKNSGHMEPVQCSLDLEFAFMDAGSFDHLDDSCAKTIKRPPFSTKLQ